jgi:hypothetical protein
MTGLDPRLVGPVFDGDTLWIMTPVPDGWEIGHYEMPALRRIATFRVPERRPADARPLIGFINPIDLVADGDHVVILNGGWLSTYDRSTGQPLGAPVRLDGTPAAIAHISAHARVWPRPGHPGQVAVNVPGSIELWEMPSGRLIRRIETLSDKEPVFDPSGSRMAVPNGDHAIEVWDVDQGVQVRPPVALPEQSTHVVAFQPDGHLAVRVGPSGQEPYRLVFIELTSGRQAGVMRLTDDIGSLNPEDQSVGLRSSSGDRNPADLRIAAGGWRDALCGVIDRPFTPAERALLPPGADPTPPCS